MQIHISKVTEVTPVQPQQPGCIDNKIWRKKMNELVSHKALCRTALATPGLLISYPHTIPRPSYNTGFCGSQPISPDESEWMAMLHHETPALVSKPFQVLGPLYCNFSTLYCCPQLKLPAFSSIKVSGKHIQHDKTRKILCFYCKVLLILKRHGFKFKQVYQKGLNLRSGFSLKVKLLKNSL